VRKRNLFLIVAAIAAAAMAPSSAQATKSKVVIGYHSGGPGGSWVGEVKASKLSCQNGRKVTIYRKENGKDTKVGTEKTFSGKGDSEGVFVVPDSSPTEGKYYAKVKEKGNCDADKSKDYDYPGDQPG